MKPQFRVGQVVMMYDKKPMKIDSLQVVTVGDTHQEINYIFTDGTGGLERYLRALDIEERNP